MHSLTATTLNTAAQVTVQCNEERKAFFPEAFFFPLFSVIQLLPLHNLCTFGQDACLNPTTKCSSCDSMRHSFALLCSCSYEIENISVHLTSFFLVVYSAPVPASDSGPPFHPLALYSFHGCRFLKVRTYVSTCGCQPPLTCQLYGHSPRIRACLSCILCTPFPRCSAPAFPTPTFASFAKTLACLNPTTKCSGCDSMQHSPAYQCL